MIGLIEGLNKFLREMGLKRASANSDSSPAELPDLSGPYPNGSVPYCYYPGVDRPGAPAETPAWRLKRFICASLNHHPRSYDGSWCMGYGYVCGRCAMYADPIPKQQLEAMCDTLNKLPPDQQQMAAAAMSGGGPSAAHRRR